MAGNKKRKKGKRYAYFTVNGHLQLSGLERVS
jgi:hypothetical protein